MKYNGVFVLALSLFLSGCSLNPNQPNNLCEGIAGIRALPALQVEIIAEPEPGAPRIGLFDESWGWLTADIRQGEYWHVCNWGWVDNSDVEIMVFD